MRCLAILATLVLILTLNVRAATITRQGYLKDFDPRQYEAFGSSVAVSGNTMVVGASGEFGDGQGFPQAGAAYVFVRSGTNWILQGTLKASNGYTRDQFGQSVAISGDTVVVGAFWESSSATGVNGDQNNRNALSAGAAYVFVRSGANWTQQAYLKASNAQESDHFGFSVAISGDTVVVGAYGEASAAPAVNGDQSNNSALRCGAAYVFARNGTNWTQQAYLKASNAQESDNFAWSVAVSDNTVVVGAPGEKSNATGVNGDQSDNSAPGCGAAYVFVRTGTTWTQQAYLKASDASSSDNFAWSVAVSGNTVVVGAPGASTTNDDDAGAAYVFVRSGTQWTQQVRFEAINALTDDHFGYAVAVSGNAVVVGAPFATSSAPESGAAYLFARNGANWSLQSQLLPAATISLSSAFGGSVGLADDTFAVGAPGDNTITPLSGAAYVFAATPPSPPQCDGFCITSFKVQPNSVSITWRAQPGDIYYVGSKAALTDSSWTPVSGGIIAQGTQASWTGLRTPGATAFYCVVRLED